MRKDTITRPTALASALLKAATDVWEAGGTIPEAITSWKPSRALQREAAWSITRRKK